MDPKYVLAHRISTVKSRPRDLPQAKPKPLVKLQFVSHSFDSLDTPLTTIDDWILTFPSKHP